MFMANRVTQANGMRMTRGTTWALARTGDVRIPSYASDGEAETSMMISLEEMVGAAGACSSMRSSVS